MALRLRSLALGPAILTTLIAGCSSLQGRRVPPTVDGVSESAKGIPYYLSRPTFSVVRRTGDNLDATYGIEVGSEPDPASRFEVGMTRGLFTSDTFEFLLNPSGVPTQLNSKREDQTGKIIAALGKVGASALKLAAAGAAGAKAQGSPDDWIDVVDKEELLDAESRAELRVYFNRLGREKKGLTIALTDFATLPSGASNAFYVVKVDKTIEIGTPSTDAVGSLDVKAGDLVQRLNLTVFTGSTAASRDRWVLAKRPFVRVKTATDLASHQAVEGETLLVTPPGALNGANVATPVLIRATAAGWKGVTPDDAKSLLRLTEEEAGRALKLIGKVREQFVRGPAREGSTLKGLTSLVKTVEDEAISLPKPSAIAESEYDVALARLISVDKFKSKVSAPSAGSTYADLKDSLDAALARCLADPDDGDARRELVDAEAAVKRAVGLVLQADENLNHRLLRARRDVLGRFLQTKIPDNTETAKNVGQYADQLKAVLAELQALLPSKPSPAAARKQATEVTSRVSDHVHVIRPAARLSEAVTAKLRKLAEVRVRYQISNAVVIANPCDLTGGKP